MNKQERNKIEAKVRALAFEQIEGSIMPFSDMRANVLAACAQRNTGSAPKESRAVRKAGGRQILRVGLVTACLLVGVCAFSILAPIPSSTANNFLRRAQVWIGDILQIKIAEVPPENRGGYSQDTVIKNSKYETLQEAAEAIGVTLYEPAWLPLDMKLDRISADGAEKGNLMIQYGYSNEKVTVNFLIEPMGDQMGVNIIEDVTSYTNSVGTFHVWNTEKKIYALGIVNGYSVNINSTLEKEPFLKVLDQIKEIH